mmetsp:Transcript_18085/g.57415  ORF Transcript_18085/g.57415 Transcript_18085/m.57415 type:complete len:106 (-) Transcript_18085:111-428(-)
MSAKLKARLEDELGADKVSVELVPVDSSDGKPKVYTIEISGETFFDWVKHDGKMEALVAPDPSWKTPINFDTHVQMFGPGIGQEGGETKEEMYQTLKRAVEEKMG